MQVSLNDHLSSNVEANTECLLKQSDPLSAVELEAAHH
jgi:hypothetical protein